MVRVGLRSASVSPEGGQLRALLKAALPPLLARYVWRSLRVVWLTPQGRAIGLALGSLVVLMVVGPAILASLLVYLVTQNSAEAATVGVAIALVSVGLVAVLVVRLWLVWREFRRRHLR